MVLYSDDVGGGTMSTEEYEETILGMCQAGDQFVLGMRPTSSIDEMERRLQFVQTLRNAHCIVRDSK